MKNEKAKIGRKREKKELSIKEERFVDAIVNNELENSNGTLMEQLGIPNTTFYRMKESLKDAILERSRQLFRSEVPSWFKSLSKQAKKGDVQALRLALEMSREYIPFSKSEIEAKINPQINVTIMDSDVPDTHSDNNQP